MNKEYIRAKIIAENAVSQLKGIYDKAETGIFEDNKAYKALEKVLEDMEDFTGEIKHYSKDTKEGYLYLNSNGRYELRDRELSCGYPIEVYNEKYQEWNAGRVESSSKYGGYYFYNYDESNFALEDGTKARIRV